MFVAFFCPPGGGASLSSIRVEKVCRHLLAAAGQVVADGCFGPTRSPPASVNLCFATERRKGHTQKRKEGEEAYISPRWFGKNERERRNEKEVGACSSQRWVAPRWRSPKPLVVSQPLLTSFSLFALGPEFYTATIHLTPILFIHSSTHITAIAEPPVFSLTFSVTLPHISKYISSTQKESIGFSATSQEHLP